MLALTPCREIIDESDVYIDVHKAIRRLTPAPKARPQRRNTKGSADFAFPEQPQQQENDLLGLDDGGGMPERRGGSVSAHSDVMGLSTSPRMATFMMRRNSAGPDSGTTSAVPFKANLEEMKTHLKHLGPSNPATNPKNTKYTTVKIKGLGAPAVMAVASKLAPTIAEMIDQPDDEDDEHAAHEQTPLIRPKLTGKGGVQAVRRSYGAAGKSDAQERLAGQLLDTTPEDQDKGKSSGSRRGSSSSKDAGATMETADVGAQTVPSYRSELGAATLHRGSHDSLSSLPSINGGTGTPRRRHLVRSGSITENIIEAGGIQKIVLQTASSEEEENGHRSGKQRSSSRQPAAVVADSDGEDDEPLSPDQVDGPGDGGVGASSASGPANGGEAAGGTGTGQAKKKNRRKKRKGHRW